MDSVAWEHLGRSKISWGSGRGGEPWPQGALKDLGDCGLAADWPGGG